MSVQPAHGAQPAVQRWENHWSQEDGESGDFATSPRARAAAQLPGGWAITAGRGKVAGAALPARHRAPTRAP